jgi:histone acetyltransferase (RNA polymerase elongator complex component)
MPKKRVTIPLFIPHSGCPHKCVFCNQWRVTGVTQNVTPDSMHDIINKYLSAIPESVGKIEIAFFGGSFTAIPLTEQSRLLSSVMPYLKHGIIRSVRISTRPDYINMPVISLLKEFSVETVELGAQSFSDGVLRASGRGHSSRHTVEAVSLLKQNGFRVGIQLMPGLPHDTYDTSIMSAQETAELMPDDVRIYPAVVLKDTMLEKMYREGNYIPLTIEEAVDRCSVMYRMFFEKGINIIRMGLHPMDPESSNVVAGPYHAALGFLIKSRYRRGILDSIIRSVIEDNNRLSDLTILLPYRMKEEFIGMKKENILYLKNKYGLNNVIYRFADISNPQVLQ